MGLLIIGVLAVFMTGTQPKEEPPVAIGAMRDSHKKDVSQSNQETAPKPQSKMGQKANPKDAPQTEALPTSANSNHLNPKEAEEFVTWWLGGAMDYSAASAEKNRQKAMGWMTEDAAQIFQNAFWNEQIKQGITTGSIVAAFQAISVHATAVNPDGSVVVHVKGSLVMQQSGDPYPKTEHLLTDYLVKKEDEGYRIAGVHSKTFVQTAGQNTYY